MCTSLLSPQQQDKTSIDPDKKYVAEPATAATIPIGDGMADSARQSLLRRRQSIDEAIAKAGG